jgi:ketosteroid isomerase-like protein
MTKLSEKLIALERAALDRWITGDPEGYLTLYAHEVTYFDPFREKRVDGLEGMKAISKKVEVPIKSPRYEIIDPKVQRHGDVALLTFNLINYGKLGDSEEKALSRWNATEIYIRMDRQWKIIHSHWSFVKPGDENSGLL